VNFITDFNYFSNAYLEIFVSIIVISCLAHILRNVLKKSDIVVGGREYITTSVIPTVQDLSLAPTQLAFDAMSEAALKKWRDDEQHTFADYFSKIDLSGKWQNWFIGSVPIPGVGLTNNPLESINELIKKQVRISDYLIVFLVTPLFHLKIPTPQDVTYFINVGMLDVLRMLGSPERSPSKEKLLSRTDLFLNQKDSIANGYLSAETLSRADDIVAVRGNIYMKQSKFYVNSSKHLVQDSAANVLSADSVKQFLKPARKEVSNFYYHY
jgi:hypothetical protein